MWTFEYTLKVDLIHILTHFIFGNMSNSQEEMHSRPNVDQPHLYLEYGTITNITN